MVPSQGFRHAATLLLTNSLRMLPHEGSPALVAEVLTQIARDLVALADDTRASADVRDWVINEYTGALDRVLPVFSHRVDADFPHLFEAVRVRAVEILADIGTHSPADIEPRDLFVMYVPEDRLPVAAPLAIELTKRRFTVAFSEYEIATIEQMTERLDCGVSRHRAGILLVTSEFLRKGWRIPPETDRFRIVKPISPVAAANELAVWLTDTVPNFFK
jgi:hypothetical protein